MRCPRPSAYSSAAGTDQAAGSCQRCGPWPAAAPAAAPEPTPMVEVPGGRVPTTPLGRTDLGSVVLGFPPPGD